MKIDFKNIILGIIIGILVTLAGLILVNDVSVEIQIGDELNEEK